MSEVILESPLKQRTIQEGQVPIWNKVYVTLWLLVRNCLFWFLKKISAPTRPKVSPSGHTRLKELYGDTP